MTSGQKIAFSLLTAMFLFAGFILTLNTTLFDQLETRFYTQAKIQDTTEQLNGLSESCDSYITDILNLIEKGDTAWVKQASVRSYYVQNPSESDVNERRHLTEQLFNQLPPLKGIRIIDKNGRNVHYSSFDDTDILKVSGITKVYKNYPDIQKDADELPFELLEKKCSSDKSTILLDEAKNRLILYVPFSWIDGINSGLCLFYFNIYDIQQELINTNKLSLGQNITMFAKDDLEGGFVFGVPAAERKEFKAPVEKYWNNAEAVASLNPEKLLQKEDGSFYVILTSTRHSSVRVSGIYNSGMFELSREIRILIYICIFITILLIIFLIFSFNRDPVITLKKRIKKIQFAILDNYLDNKGKAEWSAVAGQLRLRKKDFAEEILKSLHVHSKKRRKELNEYLDKNWEEIFAIFDTKAKAVEAEAPKTVAVAGPAELTGASIEEIRRVLEEVLASHNFAAVPVSSAPKVKTVKKAVPVPVTDDVEEIEEVEEIEDLAEDLDEVEDLAEDVEDLAEELDDVEEIEDAEEVLDEVDDVEDMEEVEELAEDVDDVEEIEDAEEVVDEVDDVEDMEEVEELAEDVDDVEEIEDAEEVIDDVEEIEDAEEVVDDVEEIEDAEEEVEDLEEEVDDVENLDDEVEEEIEDLVEEVEQEKPDYSFPAGLLNPVNYEYKPSNDTYFESDEFPTVENLYGEQLCLGGGYKPMKGIETGLEYFKIYNLAEYPVEEPAADTETVEPVVEVAEPVVEVAEEVVEVVSEEPVEELTEDVPELSDAYYSMTGFGDNYDDELLELESENSDVIVETDGVFSITEGLDCSTAKQDPDFKALVDSIL